MKRSAPQRLVDRQGPRRELIRCPILLGHHPLHRTEYREGSSQFCRILRIPGHRQGDDFRYGRFQVSGFRFQASSFLPPVSYHRLPITDYGSFPIHRRSSLVSVYLPINPRAFCLTTYSRLPPQYPLSRSGPKISETILRHARNGECGPLHAIRRCCSRFEKERPSFCEYPGPNHGKGIWPASCPDSERDRSVVRPPGLPQRHHLQQ